MKPISVVLHTDPLSLSVCAISFVSGDKNLHQISKCSIAVMGRPVGDRSNRSHLLGWQANARGMPDMGGFHLSQVT